MDTGANYGELLALIVKEGEAPDYWAYKKKGKANFTVIRIGKGATLRYEEKKHRLIVSNRQDSQEQDMELDASYLENAQGQLDFEVNDTVITASEDFSLEHCKASETEKKWRVYSKELYEALRGNPQDPTGTRVNMAPGVWYLDNEGSFTVSILAGERPVSGK